jgi:hypothetical protein
MPAGIELLLCACVVKRRFIGVEIIYHPVSSMIALQHCCIYMMNATTRRYSPEFDLHP